MRPRLTLGLCAPIAVAFLLRLFGLEDDTHHFSISGISRFFFNDSLSYSAYLCRGLQQCGLLEQRRRLQLQRRQLHLHHELFASAHGDQKKEQEKKGKKSTVAKFFFPNFRSPLPSPLLSTFAHRQMEQTTSCSPSSLPPFLPPPKKHPRIPILPFRIWGGERMKGQRRKQADCRRDITRKKKSIKLLLCTFVLNTSYI